MSKNYTVQTAEISCQYGQKSCKLKPWYHRHVVVGQRIFGNETDIGTVCMEGDGFGSCRSPYLVDLDLETRSLLSNIQQLVSLPLAPCKANIVLQWQNSKEDVLVGGYKALMEDGWTFCTAGMGFLALISSGQEDENPVTVMLMKIDALEKEVDAYMEENGIDSKYKSALMESVMLWNGYLPNDIFWDYESSEIKRQFNSYLENENPSLFQYFERGLYVQDKTYGEIDLSYMMGIYMAVNGKMDPWECVSETMVSDRGMYNGYLEACRQQPGKSTEDMLKDFLKDFGSPNYNGGKRYTDYINTPDQFMRDSYYNYNSLDRSETSLMDENLAVISGMVAGRIVDTVVPEVPPEMEKPDLNDIIRLETEKSEEVAGAFTEQLRTDSEKGGA